MSQILFYAVQEDLLALLENVASQGKLKYALTGNFLRSEIDDHVPVFLLGAELPNLGRASADSSAACDSFVVCDVETPVNLRMAGINGERVCVDQLANPDSVEFKPGGIWNENVVIQGRIATVSDSHPSQALMKRFQTAIKKVCSIKIRSYHVGAKALALLREGKRLTAAVQSPPESDLALPNSTG
ncbi:hypothetical protein [Tuwongella immobilis]|uniref:Uncharacterized protein n=1 Tax=Tuwongella immobilis TaxID=692036 RepID=A0A6C2YH26_9BACT|nr:hypothetical protein [Tuwongella immobilis]VIP00828.1 Uncharacterized protein OS=Mesorhizobium sp. LSJC280B00 GN=X772_27490 PE=4 SV=1 [Tuwongella immobilis]VTR97074.1 Uncharacterized protein OS=Mesorhizobium sp. LSJC280B00 GN=X772_27490 PE=4 SV=1 [Tuwongella immobilis]